MDISPCNYSGNSDNFGLLRWEFARKLLLADKMIRATSTPFEFYRLSFGVSSGVAFGGW
jgi:hypothetical protein